MIDSKGVGLCGPLAAGSLDALLTLDNVNRFGLEIEANPIISWSAEHVGIVYSLILVKATGLAGMYLYEKVHPQKPYNRLADLFTPERVYKIGTITWGIAAFSNLLLRYLE